MNRVYIFICLLVFLSLNAEAAKTPDSSLEFVQNCRTNYDCETALFREISKILRPSKEEAQVASYILQLKEVAEKNVWMQTLPSAQDSLGNLVIEIPATGKFINRKSPSIAIQGHMDMVLAHRDAKVGQDLREYFKDGVEIEITGDTMHSKNRLTTLGADDGIGIAMAIRYMLDSSLAHPPLELVFTVQEEIGLAGALAMQVPLKSRQLINLDGMTYEPNTLIVASQGSSRSIGNGTLPAETEPANSARVRITIGNLAGGHSGADIFLNRLNGVRGASHILSHLQGLFKDLRIVSVVAGDAGALNKIPNAFVTEISLPAKDVNAKLLADIETEVRILVQAHVDDNVLGFTVKTEQLVSPAAAEVLTAESGKQLIEAVLAAPNGVLEEDASFPNDIKTSSNLGAFKILAGTPGNFDILIGSLSRSFFYTSLLDTVQKIQDQVKTAFNSANSITFKDAGTYPPWLAPESSALVARALSLPQYFKKTTPTTVGIEPSAFISKYPDMDIISFAPRVMNAHTINEEISVSSLKETIDSLQALLALD